MADKIDTPTVTAERIRHLEKEVRLLKTEVAKLKKLAGIS